MRRSLYTYLHLSLLPLLIIVTGCGRTPKAQPQTQIPGYSASLLFEERFDGNLTHWRVEGQGQAAITENQRLQLLEDSSSQGLMLWSKASYSGSFLLELEVDFPLNNGAAAIFICNAPKDDNSSVEASSMHSGALKPYASLFNSYQVDIHGYSPEGLHQEGSKLIKNHNGRHLLTRSAVDPCKANRFYLLNFAKTGNRLQFFVDNEKIHDLRDRGGFSPVLKEGQIGLWIHGGPGFTTFIDNIRVFRLNAR